MKKQLLEVLEKNARYSEEQLAIMLGTTEDAVREALHSLKESGTVLGYHALIDWEKAGREVVTAQIEVKVTPQRGLGFDKTAERIAQYPEVKSVYLVSGVFDLAVFVEGKSMKEISAFVSETLAVMESVMSCTTHFLLKKYKENGFIFGPEGEDERPAILL